MLNGSPVPPASVACAGRLAPKPISVVGLAVKLMPVTLIASRLWNPSRAGLATAVVPSGLRRQPSAYSPPALRRKPSPSVRNEPAVVSRNSSRWASTAPGVVVLTTGRKPRPLTAKSVLAEVVWITPLSLIMCRTLGSTPPAQYWRALLCAPTRLENCTSARL